SEIQWLDVSNNRLTILPGEAFRSVGLVNLHKVYMRECDIEELHKDALNGLEILIEIDLSGNKIKTLHPGVFSHNGRLRIIILNRNPIQKVMNRVFSNLTFLQTVEMNDCQIAHVAHEAFVKVGNLQTLRLAGNNLTNMKPDTLRRMDRLKSLELHNNPWNCDCHLKTFWDWIMAQNLYAQPTACQDPEPLRGRLWSDLTGDSLACKPEVWLHPADGRLKVDGGGDATLSCRVQGNPEPTVHWVYKSRIIGNHSRRSMNDHPYVVRDGQGAAGAGPRWVNLTVVEARFSDEGEYACVARNPGGMAEAKTRLEVVDSGSRGVAGVLGGTISDAWLLILGLVVGMVVLLVIVVVLVCCYCRTKDPRTNNNTKKAMGEGVSSNGDLSYHSGPGSEQEKSLITVVNPVQKPPRRYETLSTSTPNELEMKATLLDNGSVITGPSVAECDDPLQDRSLESLANVQARSRETIDAECLGRGGGGVAGVPLGAAGGGGVANLPPDLLSFPSRGSQVSPADASASTHPDTLAPAPHAGPPSPVPQPLYTDGRRSRTASGSCLLRSQVAPSRLRLTGQAVVLPAGLTSPSRAGRAVPSWSSRPRPLA
ncbi:Peroxidasin, partial [Gryllus bimaculatus]